jgi:hypothetical protein
LWCAGRRHHRGPVGQGCVDSLGLEPWQPGEKAHYIRLKARALTGRRFKMATPDIWNSRLTDRRRASFE